MRRRPAVNTQPQWWLAVLCLLGSLVFTFRTVEVSPPGPPGHHAGAHPAAHRQAREADLPAPSQSPEPTHGAHCPFCLTAAFALVPPPFSVPAAGPEVTEQRRARAPQVKVAVVRHADPRAPPAS
ncbi:DUF2946 family protein [Deinococcus hohokamensis]|uniref:DUF2946 family protein n=1 Tax=Deinococcus hohokamensis TaxID=309883 RepID=A0ABV9I624_9DEIO